MRGVLLLLAIWAVPNLALADGPAPVCKPGDPPACLGLGPTAASPPSPAAPVGRSVTGAPLAVCSTSPLTGFTRNGRCETGPDDGGVHVICAAVTEAFLRFTKQHGNDLSTPHPEYGFAGLVPGDRWCLCASRWAEAQAAGLAPPVVLEATHEAALRHVPPAQLEALALRPRP